jgi:hypothetical protein
MFYELSTLREELTAELRDARIIGYASSRTHASEPLALAAMALHGQGESEAAQRCSDALAVCQDDEGKVGVRSREAPYWPTALAALLWAARGEKKSRRKRAVEWLMHARGEPIVADPDIVGHQTSLIAWPWVLGTHSWVEPTAMAVAALKANGLTNHARTREAVRLLEDRMLPTGGCNYGNTEVLGQTLRPHLQPSGLCLWALAGESKSRRTHLTLDYVRRATERAQTPWSFAWGAIGLAAWNDAQQPKEKYRAIADSALRQKSPMSLALAILALQGAQSLPVKAIRKEVGHAPEVSKHV